MSDVAYVAELPPCDFHNGEHPAEYDFRTPSGSWANGCENVFRAYHGRLGTGRGQKLVVGEKPAVQRSKQGRDTLAEMVELLGGDEDEILMLADDMGMSDLFD